MRTNTILCTLICSLIMFSCKPNNETPKKEIVKTATIVSRTGLFLRTAPDAKSKKIDFMTFGTKVIILSNNGPRDELNDKEGNWYKIKFHNNEGWAFGGYIFEGDRKEEIEKVNEITKSVYDSPTFLISDLNKSEIPVEFNNITIVAKSVNGLCMSEPDKFSETLILESGKVKYMYQCYCGYDNIKITQEGKYTINNKSIVVNLNQGIKEIKNESTGKFIELDELPKPKIIILYWIPSINGFITDEMIKYFKNDKLIHNIQDFNFISTEDEIDRKLCNEGSFLAGNFFTKGYYHKNE